MSAQTPLPQEIRFCPSPCSKGTETNLPEGKGPGIGPPSARPYESSTMLPQS